MGAVQRRANWTGVSEDVAARVLAALGKAGVRCYATGEGETSGVQAVSIPVEVKESIDAMVSGTPAEEAVGQAGPEPGDEGVSSEGWYHSLDTCDEEKPSEADTDDSAGDGAEGSEPEGDSLEQEVEGDLAGDNLVDIGGGISVQPDVEVLGPQPDTEVEPKPEVEPDPKVEPEPKKEPIRDDLTVREAVPIIGTMSSMDALKDWRRMDKRVGVQEAIKARLAELKKGT